jgi:signal transduction histidine kinase/ABC-type nitrate/sulfonate/bicarbonate transport system substrate-binding protein
MKIFLLLFLISSSIFAQTKIDLALEWEYQFEFAGYIAAKEKGFYKDAGFDVNLVEYKHKDTIDALLEEEADFATNNSKVVLDKMQGKDIVLVANFFKKSALVFLTQDNIRSPRDFVGKTIMATDSELSSSSLKMLLSKFKIKESDYKRVDDKHNTKAFIQKEVDVMSAFITNEPYDLKLSGYKYNILDPVNYGIYTYDANLITSKKYSDANPKKVKAFRDATIKGWKYALKNKEEIVDIIYNKYSKKKSKNALLYEAIKIDELVMSNVFDIGSINKSIVESIANTYVNIGLSDKDYNLNGFLFNTSISKIDAKIKLTKEEKKYLNTIDSIKMCVDPNLMPFEALKDGEYIGISADYMKLIGSKIDKKIIPIIETSSWHESLELAKQKKCDIFPFLVETPQRKKFFNFTKPHYTFTYVVATLNDKRFVDDIKKMKNKRLSVVKGYASVEVFKRKYKDLTLVEVENIEDGLKLVRQGRVYGHIDILYPIAYNIEKNHYSSLKINGKLDEIWDISIGVRKDNPTLFNILQKASLSIDDKTKEKILNRWLSIRFETGFDYDLFYKIVVLFVIVVFFILFRHAIALKNNKKLKKLQNELKILNDSLQIRVDAEIKKSIEKDKFLQEQSKLAAMGEMVGAIAHQWRQPLNSLNINIQNLDDDYDDGLIDKKFISSFIQKQSQTIKFMSKTIDDFRNFFRIDKEKVKFSVKEAIESTVNIQSAQFTSHNIEIILPEDDFIINSYKSEFQQVILNITTNARDALLEKNIKNPTIQIIIKDKKIMIKDNALGIAQNILNRIFEPYFTTKEQGAGTGMGLYMSKMIIEKNMHGRLSVKNDTNGAVFTIEF